MAKNFSSFSKALLKAKTEEEVKHAYAGHFGLDYDTEFRHDLYSPEIFFEFKFSRSLQKRNSRAAVVSPQSWPTWTRRGTSKSPRPRRLVSATSGWTLGISFPPSAVTHLPR